MGIRINGFDIVYIHIIDFDTYHGGRTTRYSFSGVIDNSRENKLFAVY